MCIGHPPVSSTFPNQYQEYAYFHFITSHILLFSLSSPPLSLLPIPPSSPSLPTNADLLLLEVSEVVQIGGTEELNDGTLF